VIRVTRRTRPERARLKEPLFLTRGGGDDLVMSEAVRAELREIVAARAALDEREVELIVRGRENGLTWAELGDDLGLTAGGVRRRHLAVDPIFARRSSRSPTIAEYHEEMLRALSPRR
jgi:hypothetical protein